MMRSLLILLFITCTLSAFGQNVGVGITSPLSKLHVKGSDDVSQLIIDADSTQSGTNPLLRFRNSSGADILWLHSAGGGNVFLGVGAGRSTTPLAYSNTFIGSHAGYSNVDGIYNVAVGSDALDANVNGGSNVALGRRALTSNLNAWGNVALGNDALFSNTSGEYNTALGQCMGSNESGNYNLAVGPFALETSLAGSNGVAIGVRSQSYANNTTTAWDNTNTSVGYYALRGSTNPQNNTGLGNTAMGWESMLNNRSGAGNTASGYKSLYSNTTGLGNTALGHQGLYANQTGNYNTAVGSTALVSNTDGGSNVAIGRRALYSNLNAWGNVALGNDALFSNTSGEYNTALGQCMGSNESGNYNLAVGPFALETSLAGSNGVAIGVRSQSYANNTITAWDNTNTSVGYYSLRGSATPSNNTGLNNTAIGREALYINSEGDNNTAIGYKALFDNSIGVDNTAVGHSALPNNISGNHNTAIGFDAGGTQNSGNDCTFLGYSAEASAGTYLNAMAIGYQATVNDSNEIRIGNSAITEIGGYEPWTNLSDGRFKKNITENVSGLNFVLKLRPVTYNLEVNKLAAHLKEDEHPGDNGQRIHIAPDAGTKQSRDAKEQILYTGFIAQEVEDAAKSIGYDFSAVAKPDNKDDLYGLSYAEFVVPLVKAVQELQAEIEELKKEIQELKKNSDQ